MVPDRIVTFLDQGSFAELRGAAAHRATAFGMGGRVLPGDGVVTGTGTVDGRPVCVFAQDRAVLGGSLGEVHATKIERIMELASSMRCPVVGIVDSSGARLQEGLSAVDGYGRILRLNAKLSGRVPQVGVIAGACAGGAVYSAGLMDVIIMAEASAMFLTGPRVVRSVTAEDVSTAELGGTNVHARISGVAHLVAGDVTAALASARAVLSYLPSSCWHEPPGREPAAAVGMPDLPVNLRLPYDVRGAVRGIVDSGSFLELQPIFAANMVTGLARLAGQSVGVLANQPMVMGGALDANAAEKSSRFVRMCDAFGIPLLVLVDTPGFLPGLRQEHAGIIRRGAKLLYTFSEASVPRVSVILRKAFGGGYLVMNSRSLGADAVFAFPNAQLAAVGAEGAVDLLCRRELADDPSRREGLIKRYRDEVMDLRLACERMLVDEVITPERVRDRVATTFAMLRRGQAPRFRHDNMPQ